MAKEAKHTQVMSLIDSHARSSYSYPCQWYPLGESSAIMTSYRVIQDECHITSLAGLLLVVPGIDVASSCSFMRIPGHTSLSPYWHPPCPRTVNRYV